MAHVQAHFVKDNVKTPVRLFALKVDVMDDQLRLSIANAVATMDAKVLLKILSDSPGSHQISAGWMIEIGMGHVLEDHETTFEIGILDDQVLFQKHAIKVMMSRQQLMKALQTGVQ